LISRAVAPRCPVSRRLTLDVLISSRSATCSAVRPFALLSSLSSVPSSRRRIVGLPVACTSVPPLSLGVRCNTPNTREGILPLNAKNGTCHFRRRSSPWESNRAPWGPLGQRPAVAGAAGRAAAMAIGPRGREEAPIACQASRFQGTNSRGTAAHPSKA
jgi:hypothetical protein